MKHLYKPFFITLLALAAVLCMGVCALAAEAEPAEEPVPALSEQFGDLSYSENATALSFMIDRGFIAGYTDGTFRPGRSYTRLELAQLVTALCELETVSGYESSFYDCELAGAESIDAAVSNGLMTGRSVQSFDPYGTVLKAEMLGTLEKAAAYLELDGFYDHAAGGYTDWATDYTICTADEAMQSAYQLAQALELRAEAEAKAAEVEATANAVTELTGEGEPSAEPEASAEMPAASGEPSAEPAEETETAEAAESTETETTEAETTEAAPASAEPQASGEMNASGEPSAEPAAQEEPSTPPAGVTTPASAAAPTAPQQSAPTAPQTDSATADSADESDELRNEVKGKYADIRDSILAFLRDLLGV